MPRMAYRTILVDLSAGQQPVYERLGVARALAARFEATLVGLHATPPLGMAGWDGGWSAYIPPEYAEAERRAKQAAKDACRAAFDQARGSDPGAVWREVEGYPGWSLVRAAHAADLVVAARDDRFEVVEQIVTSTGVPVLMVPPGVPAEVGREAVVVAWKSSREAARAVHDALPFLRSAGRVVLCAVGGGGGRTSTTRRRCSSATASRSAPSG